MPLCGIHFNTRIKPHICNMVFIVTEAQMFNNVNHIVTVCTTTYRNHYVVMTVQDAFCFN